MKTTYVCLLLIHITSLYHAFLSIVADYSLLYPVEPKSSQPPQMSPDIVPVEKKNNGFAAMILLKLKLTSNGSSWASYNATTLGCY